MRDLIQPFLRLCALQANPQDLPASRQWMAAALAAYLLTGMLLGLQSYDFGLSLLQALIDTGLLLGYSYTVLSLAGRAERFPQTTTALAGSGTILGLVALPLMYAINPSAVDGGEASPLVLLYLLLLIWLLAVYGHIFRHALERGLGLGVLLSIGYAALTTLIIGALLPPTAPS